MSYDLYYSFHTWAMRTKNPAWAAQLKRIELMYPRIECRDYYISPSTWGE